jgi:hypothetical protein
VELPRPRLEHRSGVRLITFAEGSPHRDRTPLPARRRVQYSIDFLSTDNLAALSGSRPDRARDGPDESGKFTRHGYDHLVRFLAASPQQPIAAAPVPSKRCRALLVAGRPGVWR